MSDEKIYSLIVELINMFNNIDEMIDTNSNRMQEIDLEINDWLHYIENNEIDEKQSIKIIKEVKKLRYKNDELEYENSRLKTILFDILKKIKTFFRNILHIGDEHSKNEVVSEIKDYYDNDDFTKDDVYDIAESTSKEDELFEYANIEYDYVREYDDYDMEL